MGTIEHEEVVSRHDASALHHLGEITDASGGDFSVLWLFAFRLGRLFLAGRDSRPVLLTHAMLRQ